MKEFKFPDNFYWGGATSGPQSEGWEGKKHMNIYDEWFKMQPYRFHNFVGPEVASDVYNKYKIDCDILGNKLNFNSYRISIQWTRLIKDFKTGEIDEDGYNFYLKYIQEIIACGMEPFVNLYHFDMPFELQEIGGWENKEVIEMWNLYAKAAFESYGHLVKRWVTMNEPIVPVEGGYLYDFMYPNKVDFKAAVNVAYNTIYASALAIKTYKELKFDGKIGIILNLTPSMPRSDNEYDLKAADFADMIFNRSFLEPCINGNFEEQLCSFLDEHDLTPITTKEELAIINEYTIDYLGVNYYQPRRVKARETLPNPNSPIMPEWFFENYEMPGRRMNIYRGWEIAPDVIYVMAKIVQEKYNNIEWYISENGMGVENEARFIKDGEINDDYRIDFTSEHLSWLHKAIEEGSNCIGYHVWAPLDNWSWMNSYKNRYGLVSINIENQERTIKKSGYWFADLAKDNKFDY